MVVARRPVAEVTDAGELTGATWWISMAVEA
jgi:hypothetical protein